MAKLLALPYLFFFSNNHIVNRNRHLVTGVKKYWNRLHETIVISSIEKIYLKPLTNILDKF